MTQKATRAADVKSPMDRAKDAGTAAQEAVAAHPYAAAGIAAGTVAAVAGIAYAVTRNREGADA
jgi:ElaB/YqjD/DUF883 family membrane-anchored ribosome-binding protein